MKILKKNIFSLFVFVIIGLAVYEVLKLDVLPSKYLMLFLVFEGCLFILGLILYNLKKKFLFIIGIILYILLILGNIIGYFYLSKVNNYVTKTLTNDTYSVETKYYLVAYKDDEVSKKEDIRKDAIFYFYKYSRSIDKAKKMIGDYTYESTDSIFESLKRVKDNRNYLLIGMADYNYLFDGVKVDTVVKSDYKIIYEFTVVEKMKINKDIPDSYNVYLNGLDFTGVMRDYNLIVTVNTKAHKIVLTSIPRDFYIDVPAYNMKDTLMCLGSLDSEVSKEALEKLFNTKIDYSLNLNTHSLVGVVDAIDGVDFCSDYDFYTTHALVTDTYDDTKGTKLHVPKGCATYNGIEILAIARERNAFPGRDRYRQKNCRQILLNITKKLASTTTLTNYNEVLASFDGLYTTDLNDKVIKNLIKEVLDDQEFEIIEQSVDGIDGIGIGHLGTQESWIMNPSMDTVEAASNKINEVLNEK